MNETICFPDVFREFVEEKRAIESSMDQSVANFVSRHFESCLEAEIWLDRHKHVLQTSSTLERIYKEIKREKRQKEPFFSPSCFRFFFQEETKNFFLDEWVQKPILPLPLNVRALLFKDFRALALLLDYYECGLLSFELLKEILFTYDLAGSYTLVETPKAAEAILQRLGPEQIKELLFSLLNKSWGVFAFYQNSLFRSFIDALGEEELTKLFSIQNEDGDTLLHRILKWDEVGTLLNRVGVQVLRIQNKKHETSLHQALTLQENLPFISALFTEKLTREQLLELFYLGNRERLLANSLNTFLQIVSCLHQTLNKDDLERLLTCQNRDGATLLHEPRGLYENFSQVFQLIGSERFKYALNVRDFLGQSPLHKLHLWISESLFREKRIEEFEKVLEEFDEDMRNWIANRLFEQGDEMVFEIEEETAWTSCLLL